MCFLQYYANINSLDLIRNLQFLPPPYMAGAITVMFEMLIFHLKCLCTWYFCHTLHFFSFKETWDFFIKRFTKKHTCIGKQFNSDLVVHIKSHEHHIKTEENQGTFLLMLFYKCTIG